MSDLVERFKELRFDEKHHLGLGDIRLTISEQDEITEELLALRRDIEKLEAEAKHMLYGDHEDEPTETDGYAD